ncbi:mobilization protein [Phocaeicola abscessus]|uniref:mobilization protein n=1 Tax=Phocaeicola abscessus TaxID=555313 RepID=UPI0028EF7350|nr:mobilization protein [Phocaeicola abscessus]
MATKSSIHIKPCNITSSEAHNRRTPEYMRNIGDSKIYIVPELSADNEQWINPHLDNVGLQMHYDNIKRMVKEKTGRAMQEKERERKGKNGKIIKVAGCSPIREGVLLIKADTTIEDLLRFGDECKQRWGITPLQIFMHKDEGHWLTGEPNADDKESFKVGNRWFKPNYHAHIVFDWMNHETGKSCKLNDEDMTQMQTLASEILSMERGQSKAETGKEHLERNDFILEKQKSELRNLDAVRRYKEYQVELAEQEVQKAESITQSLRDEAMQKEEQSKMLDKAINDKRSKLNKEKGSQLLGAFADWATGKSKAMKDDIEDLRLDLAEAHEAIAEERKRTQAETAKLEAYKKFVAQQMENAVRNATLKKEDEINNLKDRISWRDKMLGLFTKLLARNNSTFRSAIDAIISFAKDTYRSIFSREEAKSIKSVMEAFGKDKEDYKTIGTFLMFTADKKENLSNSEYRKASREVSDIAIGRYEQTHKRGYSMKM